MEIFLLAKEFSVKPGLHLNANRTQMQYAKTMRTIDVDVLPRQCKQHLAVEQMYGEQQMVSIKHSNTICQTVECYPLNSQTRSIEQPNMLCQTADCCQSTVSTSKRIHITICLDVGVHNFHLTAWEQVYSLPRRIPNNVRMYHVKLSHCFHMPHSHSVRIQV